MLVTYQPREVKLVKEWPKEISFILISPTPLSTATATAANGAQQEFKEFHSTF